MELKASPSSVIRGAWLPSSCANPSQLDPCQIERLGVPVETDQAPRRPQQPRDFRGVARHAQRAVDVRAACAHIEKIHRFF